MDITRDKLKRRLTNSVVEVTFTKVNGEQRIMSCTLNENILPKADKSDPLTQKKVRELNEEVLSVWDVNAKGWRSFRVENVTDVRLLGGVCVCGKSDGWPICDGSHNDPAKEVKHTV